MVAYCSARYARECEPTRSEQALLSRVCADVCAADGARRPTRAISQTLICSAFPDGETRTRTGDTTIFSRMLYQLSYLARTTILAPPRGLSHWVRVAQTDRAI
jgi:hypothetical protein